MLRVLAQALLLSCAWQNGLAATRIDPVQSFGVRRAALENRQILNNTLAVSGVATGLSSAAECAQTLASWHSSFTSWSLIHNLSFVSTETETLPAGTVVTVPYFSATSLTTLCDGHPRVVGSAASTWTTSTLGSPHSNTTSQYPVTSFRYNVPPYPTPQPCSIPEDECQALYNQNASMVFVSYSSICNLTSISTTTHTYATASTGGLCSLCYLRAKSARLLYWPVRTVEGSDNICSGSVQTVGLLVTGDGPNTFVTDGITITSPSVGISFASVSRVDGCFTTLESTVIVVPASEVMSARSARALYDHEPFRYQDLNYKCQPANSSTSWIQDEPGNDCFQQVPAAAYFIGESAFAWDEYYPTAYTRALTIGDDYRPYVLLPSTMTEWANSVFHTTSCEIQVNGIWDPPRALIPGTAVETPVVAWSTPPAAAASSTVSAAPAEADHTQLPGTSTAQVSATSTALADSPGSGSQPSIELSPVSIAVTSKSAIAAPTQNSPQSSAGVGSASASSDMQGVSGQLESNAATDIMGASAQNSQYLGASNGQPSSPAFTSEHEDSSQQPTLLTSTDIMSTSTQDSHIFSASDGQIPTPASSNVQEESSQRSSPDASAGSTSTFTAATLTSATSSSSEESSSTTTIEPYKGGAAVVKIPTGVLLTGLLCLALLT